VRAKVTQMEGFSFVRDNGTPYATMKATGDPNQQSIVSEYEIFRGKLAQILFDLTKDNEKIKYVFGEQVASIQQRDDGPARSNSQTACRLRTCDGATSRTRAIGFGCGVREHIRPLNCWAAYFSMEQDLLQGRKMAQSWSTIGGRWLAVGPDPTRESSRYNGHSPTQRSPRHTAVPRSREARRRCAQTIRIPANGRRRLEGRRDR